MVNALHPTPSRQSRRAREGRTFYPSRRRNATSRATPRRSGRSSICKRVVFRSRFAAWCVISIRSLPLTARSTDQWRALIERPASTRPLRLKRTAAIRWPCASTRLERKRPPNRDARSLHQDRRLRLKAGRVHDSIRRRTTKWFHSPIAHSGKLASGNALRTPEGQTSLALVLYRPTQSIVAASLDDKLGLWITVLVGVWPRPDVSWRAGATERRQEG